MNTSISQCDRSGDEERVNRLIGLTNYLRIHYHRVLKREFRSLKRNLRFPCHRDGDSPTAFLSFRTALESLDQLVLSHLLRKDKIVFPLFRAMKPYSLRESLWKKNCQIIIRYLDQMERDQEKILQILNRTMSLAGSVNKKASRQSRQYQDKLRNCEYLLRDEIQIEQVILIPKIIQLCSRSIENEGL